VKTLSEGDFVCIPFNVMCGACVNCLRKRPQFCLLVNKEMPGGAYGYSMMGGWRGGQSEYFFVPHADVNCLKIPNKALAMEKIFDLMLLSDVLPTAFHAVLEAKVGVGKSVYIAGAGPIGLCAAMCAKKLLGAARIIVGDVNPLRLKSVVAMGCDAIDLSKENNLAAAVYRITGKRSVDCIVECVGGEGHGHGVLHKEEMPEMMWEQLIELCDFGGNIYIAGVYAPSDAKAPNEFKSKGFINFPVSMCFAKGITLRCGQVPVGLHNTELLNCILYGGFSVAEYLNIKLVDLQDGPEVYERYANGEPSKFVFDPHRTIRNHFGNASGFPKGVQPSSQ